MGYDTKVYELCRAFQKSIEESIEFNKPVFKKYSRHDDTQWAGWYEIKSFCPIIKDDPSG